mmetsp:Transcript_16000/g.19855  ORF Transcript_16000/g.19855 Transcript_16000/m.19855 type:complete len:241 (+) Transcript_16000:148-870(+)|eukprot:CAMPEP_0204837152 /NCGR_PEP_ID=MMETSP1346-20131115/27258_1 /ASSEMBLY_ACC=CAM_ASM_000771 /TAXON_ID=215587 /ORGANISM="Aplanochytrium stocchinoi, Strain GSBS06" /LENGTH=240 /DNA_ID=CAMNT_0051972441 /DNA_START=176 /DNA_END=898 /DNA_ORIENTATION=+
MASYSENGNTPESEFTLLYFPLKAKGLGVALVAEFSGLAWDGPKSTGWTAESWPSLKSSKGCVFGQMPYLKTKEGKSVCQTTAIVNYIAKRAGPKLEGAKEDDWIMSQMLIAEGEDLYSQCQKFQPTKFVELGRTDRFKANLEMHKDWWNNWVPNHMKILEALLDGKDNFTSTGYTAGEILFFSYLHQLVLVQPTNFDAFKESPFLRTWYNAMLNHGSTQRVLKGESNFGVLADYFLKEE